MYWINKVVRFINITDHEGQLSITNLAVYICVAKVAISPTLAPEEIGALIAVLLNYSHKRRETRKAIELEKDLEKDNEVVHLKDDIHLMKEDIAAINNNYASVAKASEEARKMMSEVHMAKAFTTRGK